LSWGATLTEFGRSLGWTKKIESEFTCCWIRVGIWREGIMAMKIDAKSWCENKENWWRTMGINVDQDPKSTNLDESQVQNRRIDEGWWKIWRILMKITQQFFLQLNHKKLWGS
jgi:hypothetical protein